MHGCGSWCLFQGRRGTVLGKKRKRKRERNDQSHSKQKDTQTNAFAQVATGALVVYIVYCVCWARGSSHCKPTMGILFRQPDTGAKQQTDKGGDF